MTEQQSRPQTEQDSSSSCDLDRIAEDLLAPMWRGIDREYKAKYLRKIWQQFEDNVRSAAYTASLNRFVQRLTTRLGVSIASDDAQRVTEFLRSADERKTLKALREEATYLVLVVRVANEERRATQGGGR